MKINLRVRHHRLSTELRDLIEQRVSSALGRLDTWISTTHVVLTDLNGPRGGVDTQCRLLVRVPGVNDIVIEQRGADVLSAVSIAVDRAARAVVRAKVRRGTTAIATAS